MIQTLKMMFRDKERSVHISRFVLTDCDMTGDQFYSVAEIVILERLLDHLNMNDNDLDDVLDSVVFVFNYLLTNTQDSYHTIAIKTARRSTISDILDELPFVYENRLWTCSFDAKVQIRERQKKGFYALCQEFGSAKILDSFLKSDSEEPDFFLKIPFDRIKNFLHENWDVWDEMRSQDHASFEKEFADRIQSIIAERGWQSLTSTDLKMEIAKTKKFVRKMKKHIEDVSASPFKPFLNLLSEYSGVALWDILQTKMPYCVLTSAFLYDFLGFDMYRQGCNITKKNMIDLDSYFVLGNHNRSKIVGMHKDVSDMIFIDESAFFPLCSSFVDSLGVNLLEKGFENDSSEKYFYDLELHDHFLDSSVDVLITEKII